MFPFLAETKDVKRGRTKAYSFSGITAKQGKKYDHKGKKKQRFVKGHKGSQGFGAKHAKNSGYNGGKKSNFQKHGNKKMHNPKFNKNRTSNISKKSAMQGGRDNKKGKPSW